MQDHSWQVSAEAGAVPAEVGGVPAAIQTLDTADAADPLQDLEQLLEEEQQSMPPPYEDMQAEPVDILSAEAASTQPKEVPPTSWWQRQGEVIDKSSIKVGGACVHYTHHLAAFGNRLASIVFCGLCGGSTQGSFSPLLAEPCRREAKGTRQRHVNRMLLRNKWPTDELEGQYGQGDLRPPLVFVEKDDDQVYITEGGCQQALVQ